MTKADGGGGGGGSSSSYGLSAGFWHGTARGSVGGVWFTALAVTFLLFFHLLRPLVARRRLATKHESSSSSIAVATSSTSVSAGISNDSVSDADLRVLIDDLQGELPPSETPWEDVIDKSKGLLSYNAKCCRQKDGSLKYWSVTTFENCSTELLKDFYMDNDYRKKWDKTVIDHEQLNVDKVNMIEVGRTIKKFPFLTPREYILTWRIWEGKNKTFYCIIKDCEHPLAPLQKKYVRVGFFRSGWRIRKVPDRDACEITMVYQEDAGLNVEMAKLVFAKGIWSYVCRMNSAFREYSSWIQVTPRQMASLPCVQIPEGLERDEDSSSANLLASSEVANLGWEETSKAPKGCPSKKWVTKGLVILGGVLCLSRGHSGLATQLAMAFFLKKLTNSGREAEEAQPPNRPHSLRSTSRRGR